MIAIPEAKRMSIKAAESDPFADSMIYMIEAKPGTFRPGLYRRVRRSNHGRNPSVAGGVVAAVRATDTGHGESYALKEFVLWATDEILAEMKSVGIEIPSSQLDVPCMKGDE